MSTLLKKDLSKDHHDSPHTGREVRLVRINSYGNRTVVVRALKVHNWIRPDSKLQSAVRSDALHSDGKNSVQKVREERIGR